MLEMFKAFLADEEALDMYVTGRAGTGKTTDICSLVLHCQVNDIQATVTAYTHKAVGVLAQKMPSGTELSTLHSFLGKRPTINQHATKVDHIESNSKQGDTKLTKVLFIDEYSMIGEKDYMDLRDAQDDTNLKIVWVGDPYQLPPVKDIQVIDPRGKYQVLLTEIKRQAKDNPLGEALEQLVNFIEGAPITPLVESKSLIRNKDIVAEYVNCGLRDKVLLAWTNERVQELNQKIQGRTEPQKADILFSPTTQQCYTFVEKVERPTFIVPSYGEIIELNSKYRTLETLIEMGVEFCELINEDQETIVVAYKFGHKDHKDYLHELKMEAASTNAAIERQEKCNAAAWARENWSRPLARKRANAWKKFLSFNSTALCLDFAHAMTIHKSQGSTYNTVFVDTDDVYRAADFSTQQYLKLMYVALSRASNQVITN